ncbi:hypothetical protein DVH24_025161 [Malus domestica]|uniref:MATH domain-containing protein n=1 Tax=Malus domestica TaxID=3750 RepID=A0A498HLS0_MALDO|nr:hypothetical protein DVH24_025161 [Malus domestica]
MCFHAAMLDAGFDRVIPLEAFTDPSNGYLIGDTCVFGAEVFVCKQRRRGKGECITLDACLMYKHPWRIEKFSKLKYERIESEPFTAGGKKWHEVSALSQGGNVSHYKSRRAWRPFCWQRQASVQYLGFKLGLDLFHSAGIFKSGRQLLFVEDYLLNRGKGHCPRNC